MTNAHRLFSVLNKFLDPNTLGMASKRYGSKVKKKQQMAAGAALAAKQGKRSKSSLQGAFKQMAEPTSEKQSKDFTKTKRSKLASK